MPEITCLLIDDDADDREFFEIALEAVPLSTNYITAPDGIKGLELLATLNHKPEFIFLDLNMPILSGKECLTSIKLLKGYENVPVIIFSTSSYQADIEDCRTLGASHFLTKTPDIDELSVIITKLLSDKNLPFVVG